MELDQSSLASGIRISLENDSAVDAGGVLRSVFVSIAKNLQEGGNPFFKCYDNNAVYFNPILSRHSELILRGFCRMIGICILQGIWVNGAHQLICAFHSFTRFMASNTCTSSHSVILETAMNRLLSR